MDNRRHEEQQQQQSHNQSQSQRANKNKKKKSQASPTTPIGTFGTTVPPPPLGNPGQTSTDLIKQMQREREHGSTTAGRTGDGDHVDADANASNNNVAGSSTKAEVIDNNHNGEPVSRSESSIGFQSASEGDDGVFGNGKSISNLNNSNDSSSVSATFTDARDDSDESYDQRNSMQVADGSTTDAMNGNGTRSDEEGDDEDDGDDESSTPVAEEYTHASLIVNLSTDNTSVDFRERRERVDLNLPEQDDEPLSSSRSAPPDLSYQMDEVDDDEVQFLHSSTPARPQPKSMPGRDPIPVVTLDSTVELDDSCASSVGQEESIANGCQQETPELSQSRNSGASSEANTTTKTLVDKTEEEQEQKSKLASSTFESGINSSSTVGVGAGDGSTSALQVMEEVQVPEVAAEAGLPKTVTILHATNGTTVYLIGTAHFSEASQADVIKTIREVQPKAVFLELCQARQHILVYDEETILREASNLNLEKVRFAIRKSGAVQGALHLLLLSISCSITKKLGMAPGGEFRVGFREAKKLRHQCDIIFGDRAFAVTLARALHSLTFWQKLKLAWQFLTTPNDITKEEIERCKEKDILEQMLEEMVGEYPSISHVFVGERDIYLAHSLWLSALATDGPVVGIVGIGHVPGITKQWGRTNETQVNEVNQMPKTSTTSIVIRKTFKIGFYCLVGYGTYRLGTRMIGSTWLQSVTLPEAVTSRLGAFKLSTFTRNY